MRIIFLLLISLSIIQSATAKKKAPRRIVGTVTLQQHKLTKTYYVGGFSLARGVTPKIIEYLDKKVAVMAIVDGGRIIKIHTVEFPVARAAKQKKKKK